MNRTIEDIQKDIELLGIKGGYDIEQLLTPQDCRRLSYEIERLNNIINKKEQFLGDNIKRLEREVVKRDNIINELEKYIKESCWKDDWGVESIYVKTLLNKLQELKGEDKE